MTPQKNVAHQDLTVGTLSSRGSNSISQSGFLGLWAPESTIWEGLIHQILVSAREWSRRHAPSPARGLIAKSESSFLQIASSKKTETIMLQVRKTNLERTRSTHWWSLTANREPSAGEDPRAILVNLYLEELSSLKNHLKRFRYPEKNYDTMTRSLQCFRISVFLANTY